jgi:putative peptidoglycan lipid II flippase
MLKSSFMGEKRDVTKAAGLMSSGTLISRILGFIRDVILAKLFGATGFTDAFFVAYRIPNLLRELFAEGAVSSGFVPVFTEYLTKEGKEEAKRLAGVVFAFMLCLLIVICLLGVIFAPYLTSLLAGGFTEDAEKFQLTITLLRIMFPFLLFISLAALAMGTLNSLRSFFTPAFAPAFFNLAMIGGALLAAPHFRVPILAIGLSVTVGGALQYGVQAVALYRRQFNLKPIFSFGHPGLKKILLLVTPVIIATAVTQINVLVSNSFATYLAAGSATFLYYAYRLLMLPISLFGISMAVALLPSMSEQAVKGDIEGLRETFSFSLRLVFFTSIPAMAGLIALAGPIVNTLFQRGEFLHASTNGTVYALLFYSYGLWAHSGLKVVRTVFYSMQDTKTPLKIAVVSVVINTLLCYFLMKPFGHGGLALALTISAAVNFLLLSYLLRSKLGRIDGRKILVSFMKISIASLAMGGVAWSIAGRYVWTESGGSLQKAAIIAFIIILCVAVYLALMYLLKSDELKYLIKMRRGRRGE